MLSDLKESQMKAPLLRWEGGTLCACMVIIGKLQKHLNFFCKALDKSEQMWYNEIVENVSIELDHDNLEIRITSK